MFNQLINRYAMWRSTVGHGVWLLHYFAICAVFYLFIVMSAALWGDLIILGLLLAYIAVWFVAGSRGYRKQLYDNNVEQYGTAMADRVNEGCGWNKWWEHV